MAALAVVVGAGLIRIEAIAAGGAEGVAAADAGRWADAVGPTRDAAASDPLRALVLVRGRRRLRTPGISPPRPTRSGGASRRTTTRSRG
jgi:hypothetical protein